MANKRELKTNKKAEDKKKKPTKYEKDLKKKEQQREKIEAKRKARREANLQKDMGRIQKFFYAEENENIVSAMKEVGTFLGIAVTAFLYWAFLLFMASLFLLNVWAPKYTDILRYTAILTVITLVVYEFRHYREKKK